jgi:hypothetical protein
MNRRAGRRTHVVGWSLCLALAATASWSAAPAPRAKPVHQPFSATQLRLVDQIGGAVNAVAVAGETAYLGVGPRVWAMDVADPAAPRVTGQSDVLGGEVLAMTAVGEQLVVVCTPKLGRGEIHILTTAPDGQLVSVGGPIAPPGIEIFLLRRLTPFQDGAYLLGSVASYYLDLHNPSTPVLSELPLPEGEAWVDLVTVGHHGAAAVAANGISTLKFFDLEDPRRPVLFGSLPVHASRLAAANGLLFAVAAPGSDWFVTAVDMADPERPVIVSQLGLASHTDAIADAVLVSGRLLVVGSAGIVAPIDIRDLRSPRPLDSITVPGEPRRAVALGSLALVASRLTQYVKLNPVASRGLFITLDAVAADKPRIAHVLAPPPGRVAGLVAEGGYAYLTARGTAGIAPGGLWSHDLAAPGSTLRAEFLDQPVGPVRMAVHHAAAYAAGLEGLMVFDLANPARPRLAQTMKYGQSPTGIAVLDEHAYVLSQAGYQFDVMDLTDPLGPRQVATFLDDEAYLSSRGAVGLTAAAGLLHLAAESLLTLDVREPERPRLVRTIELPGAAYDKLLDVAASDRLIVTASRDGVDVVDATALSAIRLLSHPTDERLVGVERVAVADGLAVAARYDGRLFVLDLSNPADPVVVATADLPLFREESDDCKDPCHDYGINGVVITADDHVLVATDGSGLFDLMLERPARPTATPSPTPVPRGDRRVYLPRLLRGARVGAATGTLTEAGEWSGQVAGVATAGDLLLTVDFEVQDATVVARLLTHAELDETGVKVLGRSEPLRAEWRDAFFGVDLAVAGTTVLVPLGAAGLAVVDIAEAAQPRLLRRLAANSYVEAVAVAGSLAYVFDGDKLRVLDLADTAELRELGSVDLALPKELLAIQLTTSGTLVIAAVFSWDAKAPGIVLVDAANPRLPQVVGTAMVGRRATAVRVVGRRAYVAMWGQWSEEFWIQPPDVASGVVVLDMDDPGNIREIGQRQGYDMGMLADLALMDPATAVAAGFGLLSVLDLTNSDLPREMAAMRLSLADGTGNRRHNSLAVRGNVIYTSDRYGTLRAFRWSEGGR